MRWPFHHHSGLRRGRDSRRIPHPSWALRPEATLPAEDTDGAEPVCHQRAGSMCCRCHLTALCSCPGPRHVCGPQRGTSAQAVCYVGVSQGLPGMGNSRRHSLCPHMLAMAPAARVPLCCAARVPLCWAAAVGFKPSVPDAWQAQGSQPKSEFSGQRWLHTGTSAAPGAQDLRAALLCHARP